VSRNAETARLSCPSLKKKSITPHTLRHYIPFRIMSCNLGRVRFSGQTADVG
jgi:hypothetical protein